jgi:HD-GYP domain-containing protein (c-di-GMP phosphodiesterase class II)
MTSDRPYRPSGDWGAACGEIEAGAGTQFDPTVVTAFRQYEPALHALYLRSAAA